MAFVTWIGKNFGMERIGPVRRVPDADRLDRARHDLSACALTATDTGGFAASVVDALGQFIPHDAACVLTVDPASCLLTGTYKFGRLADWHDRDNDWARIEYGRADPTALRRISTQPVPAAATSLLPGGVASSVRMRDLLGPAGYGDELRMMARDAGRCWGGVNLLRDEGEAPFTMRDVEVAATFSSVVAAGLRAGLVARRLALADRADRSGPTVLIYDRAGRLTSATTGVVDPFDDLEGEGERLVDQGFVDALLGAARSAGAGDHTVVPRTRLRLPSSRWIVAEASPLMGADGPTGEVAVVLDEARPHDVVSLLTLVFELSERETEVTGMVLAGLDTKGIAGALCMSAYTVQDHLKSIFAKAGVRSRRELVSRVFFDQYAPRVGGELDLTGGFAT